MLRDIVNMNTQHRIFNTIPLGRKTISNFIRRKNKDILELLEDLTKIIVISITQFLKFYKSLVFF